MPTSPGVGRPVRQILAIRTAGAQIKIRRIGVGRNIPIARHTHGDKAARFLRGQFGLRAQHRIVLARERAEFGGGLRVGFERLSNGDDCALGVVEKVQASVDARNMNLGASSVSNNSTVADTAQRLL